jgi:hypothetical protein
MKVPATSTIIASEMRTQLRRTRPMVTWFRWMIAPMDKAVVIKNAIPMASPADDRRHCEKMTADKGQQDVPFRSPPLNVMFNIMSCLLHNTENMMDMMPAMARPSVKKP